MGEGETESAVVLIQDPFSLFPEKMSLLYIRYRDGHQGYMFDWVLNIGYLESQGGAKSSPNNKVYELTWPCIYSDSCKNSF